MYETEANHRVESANQLPAEATKAFAELREMVLRRTVLPWSEHCTECVWPTCYTSCDMYNPREDGRCRRFVDGMVRIESPESVNGYILKIRFKQWGKLWTPASLRLHSAASAQQIEHRDYLIGSTLSNFPLPRPIKNVVTGKRYSLKKKLAARAQSKSEEPSCFLIECFNPTDQFIALSLTMRPVGSGQKIPFQKLLTLNPGYQVARVPYSEISPVLNLRSPFSIELIPNNFDKELTLFFGLMDFVHEARRPEDKTGAIKCVVWDLDHTLWSGVLMEDGAHSLTLKPELRKIIEELDRRGILQSVASKNNHEEALDVLKRLGVDEYFLFPQISWAPKSDALKTIARRLNIGIDSLLFVDDQEFERQQVESACPGIRTLDACHYTGLLGMRECLAPVTVENMSRRKMYQVEQERQEIQDSFKDDYKAFLKHCDIRLTVTPLTNDNLERVHELTQRTNQMNFSGNRYDRAVLGAALGDPHLDTYVLACEDRFGSYGIVGFGMVDNREPRLVDLMFSCRIQSKRVEHAFLRAIIEKYTGPAGRDFHANYRKTPRNAPSGQVFADLGMRESGLRDGVTLLVLDRDGELPDDGIIHVDMFDSSFAVSAE
jgi:FkbH-like protein